MQKLREQLNKQNTLQQEVKLRDRQLEALKDQHEFALQQAAEDHELQLGKAKQGSEDTLFKLKIQFEKLLKEKHAELQALQNSAKQQEERIAQQNKELEIAADWKKHEAVLEQKIKNLQTASQKLQNELNAAEQQIEFYKLETEQQKQENQKLASKFAQIEQQLKTHESE